RTARIRAAPRSDVAKPATTSRTRGNSRTERAGEFTVSQNDTTRRAKGVRSPGCRSVAYRRSDPLGQLVANDCGDGAALRTPLETGHDPAPDGTDVRGALVDRGLNGLADLVLAHRSRQILAECFHFRALGRGEIRTAGPRLHLDRLPGF